ncbi:hypothetical protein NDU88_006532 [Pleurodeles waltl]|uniref:Uncharacterized protein n=1 Tax=Pleurodeles waltl TaxID=8319 RepID=A0AAV7NUP4_PLEWA|nr:hypothetical protein NDU88_006532 [Pleurodeles waltl]
MWTRGIIFLPTWLWQYFWLQRTGGRTAGRSDLRWDACLWRLIRDLLGARGCRALIQRQQRVRQVSMAPKALRCSRGKPNPAGVGRKEQNKLNEHKQTPSLQETGASAAVVIKASQMKKSSGPFMEKGRLQATSTRHGEGGKDVTKHEMGPMIPDMFKHSSQSICLGPLLPGKEEVPETTIPIHNDAWKNVGLEQREGVDYPVSSSARSIVGDGNGDSPQVRSVVLDSLTIAEEGTALGEKCGTILSGSVRTSRIPKQRESEMCLAATNFIPIDNLDNREVDNVEHLTIVGKVKLRPITMRGPKAAEQGWWRRWKFFFTI